MNTLFAAIIVSSCALILPLTAQDKITYDDHIFPIFQQSCLNCHNPDKNKGGLDLSSYSGAIKGGSGGKIAEPGDTGSKIIVCLTATGELRMPPEGDLLPADKVTLIKSWIEGGLLENKNSAARKPSKPAFSVAASDPAAKPEGPPPLPADVLLDPPVIAPRGAAIHTIAAAPWAPMIAVSSFRQILLIHSDSLELIGVLPFPEGEPTTLTFTPDSRYLIVGGGIAGKSGTTITFDVTNGKRIVQAAKEFDSILGTDIRPGFDFVATGSPSRLVKIWNTTTGELVKSIKKHTDWITTLDISPDGVLLATGDRNGGVYVWEADTGGEFHTLRAHQAAITQATFRHDSNILATASEDGTYRIWEMNGGSEVKKVDAHGGGVIGLAWARDGSLLTAGRDHKVKLWKPDFNHLRDCADLPALPTAVCFDAEAKRCFIGDVNGTITVIDAATGQPVSTLQNNPPALATRIANLDKEITDHPAQLAAAEKAHTENTTKLEAHKQQITAHDTALNQAKQAHAAATQAEADLKTKRDAAQAAATAKKTEADALRPQQAPAQAELDLARTNLATTQQAGQAPAIDAATQAVKTAEEKINAINTKLAEIDAATAAHNKELTDANAALPPATQAIADTLAKIAPAEAALKAAQEAQPALEKTLTDSTNHLTHIRAVVPHLQRKKQHWFAASINANHLRVADEATTYQNSFLDTTAAFAATAADLTKQYETLHTLQKERATAQQHIDDQVAKKTITPADLRTAKKSLTEKDTAIVKQQETLRKTEREIIRLRSEIDTQSKPRLEKNHQAHALKAQYIAERDKKIE